MKVTRLGPPRPNINSGIGGGIQVVPPGGSDLQVLTSNGSNGRYWGENVRRITANGSNILLSPDVNFAAGSNIIFAISSNTLNIASTGGGGGSLITKDEGSTLSSAVTTLDFVGSGVIASGAGATTTVTIAGGGSPYLDTYSVPRDGTYGDDFDGGSLNGRWTRRNVTSGMETYAVGGGTWLQTNITSATVDELYTQGISAGDFDFICSMTYWASPGTTPMYGLFAITSTGAGRGPLSYIGDGGFYHGVLVAYQYNTNSGLISQGARMANLQKYWYRIKRVGTTITSYISGDGSNWGRGVAATDSASFDRICFGRVLGAGTDDYLLIDMFDKV